MTENKGGKSRMVNLEDTSETARSGLSAGELGGDITARIRV